MVHKYRSPCFRDLGPHRGDAHGLVASAVGALRAHAAEVCDGERARALRADRLVRVAELARFAQLLPAAARLVIQLGPRPGTLFHERRGPNVSQTVF